jgi:hypothetical protein
VAAIRRHVAGSRGAESANDHVPNLHLCIWRHDYSATSAGKGMHCTTLGPP